jgi:hypothetical protein
VNDSTRAIIILVLVIILLLAVAFLGSNYMMRRAFKSVIKMFRYNNALTPATAKTADELGFKRKAFLQLKAFRDYKPTALQYLMRQEIIKVTDDGRLYLSEETLSQSPIERRLG